MVQHELLELSEKAREEASRYPAKRFIYPQIARFINERPFLCLLGPRGAGKTVLLRQLFSSMENSFYLSLDSSHLEAPLFSLATELENNGVTHLFLDEVHFIKGFEQEIKKISDFLRIKVIFTSSCALSLHSGSHDLSRRVRTMRISPFSFREFLFFEKGATLPQLTFLDLTKIDVCREQYRKTMQYEHLFDAYLAGGAYPFALGNPAPLPLFRNILDTVLQRDLLFFANITMEESYEISKMLRFIGRSHSEGISYSSISSNVGITKYRAEKYISLLEKAFILNQVFPKGTNVSNEPKVLFAPPFRLLYRDYQDCIGALREDFFVESMRSGGFECNYLKTKKGRKTPDYLINKAIVEIGGSGKGKKQFKGFSAKEKIILTHPGTLDASHRPLFFAGMLY